MLLRALAAAASARTFSWPARGQSARRWQALARELGVAGRVSFLGWRQDAGALLAACDVFVCPSRHEPLGNVVLEAWSAARPVVAAAAQGPCELVRDGETGLLVPLEAPEPLAAAIAGLLADAPRRAALAAAGRAEFERAHAAGAGAGALARLPALRRAAAREAAA